MNADDASRREELFASLLAQYDGELADDTDRDPAVGDLTHHLDGELATELHAAEECLDLLNRVRRHWNPTGSSSADHLEYDASSPSAPPQQIPWMLGRFRIERELGRGGLGIVYLAEDPRLGRKVAIKVPRADALENRELRRRFLREGEAAARLSHPHLVTLHEIGEAGRVCYLASEYCQGPTLAAWLRQRATPVSARQAAAVALLLADAVQHAHSRGVLHRDIKPSNVLIDEVAPLPIVEGERLEVLPKLTDFGMAKLIEQEKGETCTGTIIGTVAYMSPEQAEGRGDELDVRSDVYSLGALLYEMLVRTAPYVGKNDVDTLRQLFISEPVPPRRIRAEVPRDLEAITLRCLARRPADRYATAHELATDLRRFLSHEPTVARPLGPWQIAAKWARRRPTIAALATVSVASVAIVLGLAVSYTLRLREHAEELQQAITAREAAVSAREAALTAARTHLEHAKRAYPSDMRQAQLAWNDGRVDEARRLLEKHRPHPFQTDHRSFPWHYLHGLCQADSRTLTGHSGSVNVCRYSPDGRLLASAGEDDQVRLWETARGTLQAAWPANIRDINCLAFSPDGAWLAIAGANGEASIWQLDSQQCVRSFDPARDKVSALAFTPDCKTLIVGVAAGVELWDTANWSKRQRLAGDEEPIQSLAVSPDGTTLASTSADSTIRLWELSNRGLTGTLQGHSRKITAVTFSHNGKMLASTSQDGQTKIWNLAKRAEIATFEGRGGYVRDVAFTPDDGWIVSAEDDGHAQFWDIRNLCARTCCVGWNHETVFPGDISRRPATGRRR